MLKFGFEREYFIHTSEGQLVLPPSGIPRDGVLAEARGEPDKCPIQAAFNLLAEEHRIEMNLLPADLHLSFFPVCKVSRELRIESARSEAKGLVHYQNLYGHKRHRNKQSELTAGLHISVTRSRSVTIRTSSMCSKCHQTEDEHSIEVNTIFDFAQFIRIMDEEFKSAIKESSRRPGFYEIKADGRMEYRSLPTNVGVVTVADFIKSNIKLIHGSW